MANGLWSLPLISTPFWAKRYVPCSVSSEHFASVAFSSLANPLPTASTPTRPQLPTPPIGPPRICSCALCTSLLCRGLRGRISVSTPASSRAGPHITSAAYSCERGRRITQIDYLWCCLGIAYG